MPSYRRTLLGLLLPVLILVPLAAAQETHDHPAPQHLGKVSFPITCAPAVQQPFNRAVALLHSFAYTPAQHAFEQVAQLDPHCAMAHWGIAMTSFQPLWDPPLSAKTIPLAQKEIERATELHASSTRERQFIAALDLIFRDPAIPYRTRAVNYEKAMHDLAAQNPRDVETEVFYALALLASASQADTDSRKSKARGCDPRATRSRLSPSPRNSSLPHPCLRQRRARPQGPARRARLRRHRTFRAPRSSHALAHLHAARPLG